LEFEYYLKIEHWKLKIINTMHITEAIISDRTNWDTFVSSNPSGSFLQSWLWGDFQAAADFRIQRLIIASADTSGAIHELPLHDGANWLAVCFLVERRLSFGRSYWYAPWGPVVKEGLQDDQYKIILQTLRAHFAINRSGGEMFLRIEPHLHSSEVGKILLSEVKFNPLEKSVQPKDTLLLDLKQSEDDLLRQMHSKTRYNIRIAIRHGVTVAEETNTDGLKVFYAMAREIERRGGFHYHPEKYYQKMLDVLGGEKAVSLLVARHDGEPLAAGIFIKSGKTFTYAHGVSYKKKAHVMAPHLLHWEAVTQAKKMGFEIYDFFGVAPNEDPKHSWAGISRFKRGFGGVEQHYLGAWDAVFDVFGYRSLNTAKALRNIFVVKK
jgi:lipid II:glycine glycyltransferase (peptidoglycan interpeptide bridge formation enzyme)